MKATSLVDLGCGEGLLETELSKKNFFKSIFSYDLVSTKEHVKSCDIRKLPHANGSLDVAVFCLSLMGTNYLEFLAEAVRVLKVQGWMIISEVSSRVVSVKGFQDMLDQIGLQLHYYVSNFFDLANFAEKLRNSFQPSGTEEESRCPLEGVHPGDRVQKNRAQKRTEVAGW